MATIILIKYRSYKKCFMMIAYANIFSSHPCYIVSVIIINIRKMSSVTIYTSILIHRPRKKKRSKSALVSCTQVGRRLLLSELADVVTKEPHRQNSPTSHWNRPHSQPVLASDIRRVGAFKNSSHCLHLF